MSGDSWWQSGAAPVPDGRMGIRGRFQLFVTQMSARKAMTTAMDEKAALTCRFVSFADAG